MSTTEFITLSIISALYGLILGAYLGTMVYRLKTGRKYVTLSCYCPVCSHPLALIDQLPVLSYFLLHRKCRYCKHPISFLYPLREAGCSAYYLLTFLLLHNYPSFMLGSWLFLPCMLILFSVRKQLFRCILAILHVYLLSLPILIIVSIILYA